MYTGSANSNCGSFADALISRARNLSALTGGHDDNSSVQNSSDPNCSEFREFARQQVSSRGEDDLQPWFERASWPEETKPFCRDCGLWFSSLCKWQQHESKVHERELPLKFRIRLKQMKQIKQKVTDDRVVLKLMENSVGQPGSGKRIMKGVSRKRTDDMVITRLMKAPSSAAKMGKSDDQADDRFISKVANDLPRALSSQTADDQALAWLLGKPPPLQCSPAADENIIASLMEWGALQDDFSMPHCRAADDRALEGLMGSALSSHRMAASDVNVLAELMASQTIGDHASARLVGDRPFFQYMSAGDENIVAGLMEPAPFRDASSNLQYAAADDRALEGLLRTSLFTQGIYTSDSQIGAGLMAKAPFRNSYSASIYAADNNQALSNSFGWHGYPQHPTTVRDTTCVGRAGASVAAFSSAASDDEILARLMNNLPGPF